MFKPKKHINENAIKKDFFAVKKKSKNINCVEVNSVDKTSSLKYTIELFDIDFPNSNEVLFIRSTRQRNILDFIKNKEVNNIFIFCSRIKEKYIIPFKENIKGILVQDKIFEKEKDWLLNYKNVKKNNNHSKIILFIKNNKKYVIYGSGNPSVNARNELYVFEQCDLKYDNIKKYFENV